MNISNSTFVKTLLPLPSDPRPRPRPPLTEAPQRSNPPQNPSRRLRSNGLPLQARPPAAHQRNLLLPPKAHARGDLAIQRQGRARRGSDNRTSLVVLPSFLPPDLYISLPAASLLFARPAHILTLPHFPSLPLPNNDAHRASTSTATSSSTARRRCTRRTAAACSSAAYCRRATLSHSSRRRRRRRRRERRSCVLRAAGGCRVARACVRGTGDHDDAGRRW